MRPDSQHNAACAAVAAALEGEIMTAREDNDRWVRGLENQLRHSAKRPIGGVYQEALFIPDAPPARAPDRRLSRAETAIVVAMATFVCAIGAAAGVLAAFAWEQWR